MDKTTFCWILESALLSFDGVTEKEMVEKYGIKPHIANVGIKLCSYLKGKEIEL